VNTAEAFAPTQLPLLFFVDNRRRRILLMVIMLIGLSVPITYVSWAIHKAANSQRWWALVLFALVLVLLASAVIVLVRGTYQLIKPGPVLIIYEEGFHDRRLSRRMIRWSQITMMRQKEFLPKHFVLCFEVDKSAELWRQLSSVSGAKALLHRFTGQGSFIINFAGLGGDAESAMTAIFALVEAANPDVYIANPDRGPLGG